MPSKRTPHTVCILYGFCEGNRTGAQLSWRLKQAGFIVSSDPGASDILVAHSGGCWLIPETTTSQRVFMVGLPYWPGKSLLRALAEKNRAEFHYYRASKQLGRWPQKLAWHFLYFWKMPASIRMLHAKRQGKFWQTQQLTLIRNRDDYYCTSELASLPFKYAPTFITLTGQHDDLWLHPEYYVDIIKQYAD